MKVFFSTRALVASGLVLSLCAFVPSYANAQVIVNDSFDDDNFDTNSLGTGTGFNTFTAGTGSEVAETGGNAVLTTGVNGGRRAMITSREEASVSDGTFTRFEFNDINFSVLDNVNTGLDRLYFGVRGTENTAYNMQGSPDHGYWVQIESNTLGTNGLANGPFTGTSSLWYKGVGAGPFTELASWEFDTLNLAGNDAETQDVSPTLSFALDISANNYALAISGDTVSNVTGSLSGNLTNDMLNGTGFAAWQQQVEFPNLETTIGQVVVTEGIDNPNGIPGDYDSDNDVDADDIDLLSAQLGNPASVNPLMNLDADDTITLADHDLHITTLVQDANGTGALIGDLNLDGDVDVSQISVGPGGVVNVGDASVLLANLGTTTGAGYAEGDLNGDGDVDVSQISVGPGGVVNVGDASILLANLGQNTAGGAAPGASAVPEPGSMALLAVAGIGAFMRRRR